MNDMPGRWGVMWRALRDSLAQPGIEPEGLEPAVRAAAMRQPAPVLWLLGKAQSGKTSIVRALTGSSRAEIGDGFQPCTRTAARYDFPPDAPVVSFLDTRGLGEVDYVPDEDIAWCESRAHLVMAVVKATDARPAELLDVLRAVRRRHPEWPVLVVQTCLHEAYPAGMDHVMPYPYETSEGMDRVPDALRRLLSVQREQFVALPGFGAVHCVPVDFTLAEDGYVPVDYGIDPLWAAIEEISSLGLQARLRTDPEGNDLYSRTAHPRIVGYSLAAAAIGALPVVDLALVPAVQARLLQNLAGIYRLRWNARNRSEFLGLLGGGYAVGYGLRIAGRSMANLVPVLGQTIGAVWGASASGAMTYALGKAACAYLSRRREGQAIEAETLRSIYRDALKTGRRMVREQRSIQRLPPPEAPDR